jgi:hypothetical protein
LRQLEILHHFFQFEPSVAKSKELRQSLHVFATKPPANVLSLLIHRAVAPLNEFMENDRLFYSAFPFVFLLDRGLQQVSCPK